MKYEMPPLDLEKLNPRTRDYLLAKSATEGKSPTDVFIELMDERAAAAGFKPQDDTSHPHHKEAA